MKWRDVELSKTFDEFGVAPVTSPRSPDVLEFLILEF
jgi:hypothetical protein